MGFQKYLALLLIFFLLTGNCFASAEDDFKKGVQYYKQQQYAKAVKAFNKAQRQGLKTAALYHNLGISYFKLGKYEQAKKQFISLRRFAKDKMHAEYNLGLIAKKQKNKALARKKFLLVKKHSKNKKLVTLARAQLGEIKFKPKKKPWSAYLSLSYGNDSNVTADPDIGGATAVSSTFNTLYVDGEYLFYGKSKKGLSLIAAAFNTDYDTAGIDGYGKYSIGLSGTLPTAGWKNTFKLKLEESSYGPLDYQGITQLEADTKKRLTKDSQLRLRYRYYDISSLNTAFAHLAGTRQRLRAEYKLGLPFGYTKFYVEHENNDRTNTTTRSYSPTRNTLRAYYKHTLTDNLNLRADISYRISTYPDIAPATGREDTRTRFAVRLGYKINKTWKVRARYEQTENDSTRATDYSYEREILSMELTGKF